MSVEPMTDAARAEYWQSVAERALRRQVELVEVEREVCACICDAPDRTGREWVPGSLWDAISKDFSKRIRARKGLPC